MLINIPKRTLADAVGKLERVIPARSSNPGLTLLTLKLVEQENSIIMRGSNLAIDIEVVVKADVTGTDYLAVAAPIFAQVIRQCPADLVEMKLVDQELEIRSGSFKTRLQLNDANDIPVLQFPDKHDTEIDADALRSALGAVSYAASKAEYQQIFRGILLEFKESRFRTVGTDGFRLAYYEQTVEAPDASFVIPAGHADEITRLLDRDEPVSFSVSKSHIHLESGETKLNVSLMEGTFPDYERVIPAQFVTEIEFDVDDLRKALKRASVMSDASANNRVDFVIADDQLELEAEGAYGRCEEIIPVTISGAESKISLAYNVKYLLDALGEISGAATFEFSGRTSPSLIKAPEHPEYLAMIVPLRTE